MSSNGGEERLIRIMQDCFCKRYPTREDDMYIFYMGICFLKKAIDQADASVKLDLTDEEIKKFSYREQIDSELNKLEHELEEYVCRVKGFEHTQYYFEWLTKMENISQNRSDWKEQARICAIKLHPYFFNVRRKQ